MHEKKNSFFKNTTSNLSGLNLKLSRRQTLLVGRGNNIVMVNDI